MKQRRLTSAPNTLQPGYYIFWQQRTYRVIALDPDKALVLHVEPIPEAPRTTLSLLDLCALPPAGTSAPLFAPTQTALYEQLEELYGITSTHDLSYLSRGPEKRRSFSSEQRDLRIYQPVHHRPENAPLTRASTPGERPGETRGKTLSVPPTKARPLDTRGGVFDGSRDLCRPAY